MKVLLIYHHPSTRVSIEQFSSASNHELLSLSDPLDNHIIYPNEDFDMVIVEMSDQEFYWHSFIEEQHSRVPAPFFTVVGKNTEEEMSAALNLGADAFLPKPIQPKLMAMVFTQAIKRTHLLSQLQEAQKQVARFQQQLDESLGRQKEATAEKDLTYRELLLAYSRLQELNQQKNNFLAMATHELRTPVTVMKGYHRILLDSRLGKLLPEQREVLLESEQSCSRLIRIINSLLDFSRIEAGKFELLYQEYDFVSSLNSVIQQTKEACKRKQLSLIARLNKTIPRFKFDRDKVSQVVTNLLENSIKYTPPGGKIYIAARPCFWEKGSPVSPIDPKSQRLQRQESRKRNRQSHNAVMVQVSDTGIGISPEHQQEIFNEFTQVSSNQMNCSGLGLGLAISRRIIDAHGGKIWVDSQLNSGSKFIFLLPLNPPETSLGVN